MPIDHAYEASQARALAQYEREAAVREEARKLRLQRDRLLAAAERLIAAMPLAVRVGKAMAHLGAVEIAEAKRSIEVRDWKERAKEMKARMKAPPRKRST